MPNIVTVTATSKVKVITERLGDRERRENGTTQLDADQSESFIVSPGQSLRIVHEEDQPAQPAA